MIQNLDRKLSPLVGMATLVLGVTALYWGRPVLMPLALSILLTFLLNPIVNSLHRRGIGRTIAVGLVGLLLTAILAGVLFVLGHQITTLAGELPEYKDNVLKKVEEFRSAGKGTAFPKLQKTLEEIIGEIKRDEQPAPVAKPGELQAGSALPAEKPVPVVLEADRSARRMLPSLGPIVEVLATMGLVVVLLMFMLLRLQEMRNRLIRLVGHSRLSTTTKALDEAADRISRYLVMQTTINATYGVALGFGLFLVGLPYVVLLGFLAFLMRFIPYLGPWLGALVPIGLSLAIFDGWMYPFVVIGMVLLLELFTNMILEPLLYGQSAGVSEVALIVAIAFWTWVWGPIGLVLATPLTVCLVVLCKYIPELEFVETLMGDEPVMDARSVYYQRLLAMDQDEATEVVQDYMKQQHSPEELCDEVFTPALTFAKRDAERRRITDRDWEFIVHVTRELVENVVMRAPTPHDAHQSHAFVAKISIVACPARDVADEIALIMFQRLLGSDFCEVEVLPAGMLSSEVISHVAKKAPAVFCICALPPDPLAPTRYLCKRLRDRWPQMKIIVGRWGMKGELKDQREQLLEAGADFVALTLQEARSQVLQCIQLLNGPERSGGELVVSEKIAVAAR
jgi:predicted PurR-regulated permease PerM